MSGLFRIDSRARHISRILFAGCGDIWLFISNRNYSDLTPGISFARRIRRTSSCSPHKDHRTSRDHHFDKGFSDAKSAQAIVEFSIMAPLMLFMIVGFADIYWFMRQDLMASIGTIQGAQAASLGVPDDQVIDHAVQASQGVLKRDTIKVTPCTMRTAGSSATVTSDVSLVTLTALYEPFWNATGRTTKPIRYETTLRIVAPCGVPQ